MSCRTTAFATVEMRLSGVALLLLLLAGCSGPGAIVRLDALTDIEVVARTASVLDDMLEACRAQDCGFGVDPSAAVDTVLVNRDEQQLIVRFNDAFAQQPMRSGSIRALETEVRQTLALLAPGWQPDLEVLGVPLPMLVPNLFSEGGGTDAKRWPVPQPAVPLVTHIDRPWLSASNLYGRHVAVWPSHGWYYEGRLDRWEWQRARLFQTVEDIFPMAFVVPYLAPMLERAGAFGLPSRRPPRQPPLNGSPTYPKRATTPFMWPMA